MSIRLLVASSTLCILACSTGDEPKKTSGSSGTTYVAAPQREASELAWLMLEMSTFMDSTRARLGHDQELLPFPSDFQRMLTAESTPGMVDHRSYDPFAFAFLHRIDTLYKAPRAQRQALFNDVVEGCASCHQVVCPGPLVRIEKMYLPR